MAELDNDGKKFHIDQTGKVGIQVEADYDFETQTFIPRHIEWMDGAIKLSGTIPPDFEGAQYYLRNLEDKNGISCDLDISPPSEGEPRTFRFRYQEPDGSGDDEDEG